MNGASLPTSSPAQLPLQPPCERWLIQGLWLDQACGIVGGEPKCCKSLFALSAAVAVASGRPLLGRFAVPRPGKALLYAAEDAPHVVRQRLHAICRSCDADFDALDVEVIRAAQLRLDFDHHCADLRRTVERVEPRLVILDPFARLHGGNENLAQDVAPLLGFLRTVQRRFETAVMIVHHAGKSAHARHGQTLRGSSEFHAWGDSNLFLSRSGDHGIELATEHRAAQGGARLRLKLAPGDGGPALEINNASAASKPRSSPQDAPIPTNVGRKRKIQSSNCETI